MTQFKLPPENPGRFTSPDGYAGCIWGAICHAAASRIAGLPLAASVN